METNYITIAGFETMSAQQVFDMIVTHLRKQGKKSVNGLDSCLYLFKQADDGCLRCAAGVCIDPEKYTPSIEGKGWATLCGLGLAPTTNHYLIQRMQTIHDNYVVERWEEKWKNEAHHNDLIYTPLYSPLISTEGRQFTLWIQ